MYGIINTLYYRADHNKDGLITEPELYNIYQGFDKNGKNVISVPLLIQLFQIFLLNSVSVNKT